MGTTQMFCLNDYLRDLQEVVDLDCGSSNCTGVTRAAEIMKRRFDAIGFAAELVDLGSQAGRGLFAVNQPNADHYDVLFNAHLDTVYPDGTAALRPFTVDKERISGAGCADCKAGVVAIFHAIKKARPQDINRLSIAVAYNPDEEISSVSSGAWLSSLAQKSRLAVVCEPGRPNGAFVRSRKGRAVWEVVFRGVAAHAGNNPQDGRSAILAAARFTLEVNQLQDYSGKGTSVNVGVIHGGTVCNTVPDLCKLTIDRRCYRDEDGQAIDDAIQALARRSCVDGIHVEAKRLSLTPAMPYSEKNRPLIELVNEAARLEGFEAQWADAGGGSDANRIAAAGTPVIDGAGPAGGGFHSANEYLLILTIEPRVRVLSRLLTLL